MSDTRVRLAILGSTGSIGTQALDVVREMPHRFEIVALAAGTRVDALSEQIEEFEPEVAVVKGPEEAQLLRGCVSELAAGRRPNVLYGRDGLVAAAANDGVDIVLNALVGSIGLEPTLEAIRSGKDVALANKEALVVGGHLVAEALSSSPARIIPVDSEHSAIAQCIAKESPDSVKRLILTASGGPFRSMDRVLLSRVTPDQALEHPSWRMGPRITVDSATLMNKGFEVVEACWLFGLMADSIDVVIHKESIVHSLVELVDGSTLAQMSYPDMRLPIQWALLRGERERSERHLLDLPQLGSLTFEAPDCDKFPCLAIGYEAARRRGTFGSVMNAADEVAVSAFLDGEIGFCDIPRIISETLRIHRFESSPSLDEVLAIDGWARRQARSLASEIHQGGV